MSSASAAPADKFQPAWIRSAFHGPGNGGSLTNSPRVSTTEEEPFIEPCPAVLAKNRYGREELLVLQPRPHHTPSGLEKCPIYNEDYRAPAVTTAMTEHEQRLQMNINSSKAMSSLNQSDRMAVATGGSPNGPNSPQVKGNQWTPVKGPSNWSRGASQMGTGTGLNGRANLARSLGRGNPLGQGEDQQSIYGQKYVPRGRGGAVAGRGASTTAGAAQINSRAQGLYDPRDPKDRPRNRLRSTSDDAEPADPDNGGWSQVSRFGRQNSSNAWNSREEGSWNVENSFTAIQKQENGVAMPEWFDDGDETEKPTEAAGGSFDDDGRYRQPKENHAPPTHWKQQNSSTGQPDRPNNGSQQASVPNSFSASTSVGSVLAPARIVEFFYLDPTETERGPFNKEQMCTWYQMNYFKDDLKVRRKEDTQYKTLGELKVLNGPQTVFDYKPSPAPVPAPVPAPSPAQPYGYPPNPGFNKNFFGTPGVWNEAMFPGPMFNSNVGAAFDEKDMLAEKQRYDSMQKMSPEYHQMMLMRAKQVEEQQRAVQEKELEFQRKQELMHKQFEEELLKKQMEQLELQKKLEAIEAANRARIEEERRRHEAELKIVEEQRRQDEEARRAELKKVEDEKRRLEEESRKKEAEFRRKHEEEVRRKRAEEAAEEHRKLLQKKAEEDAAKIRRMQAAAEIARREKEDQKAAKDVERMLNNEDGWSSSKPTTPATELDTPWQTATTKKSPPQKPKTAPWSTSSQASSREKTLREIQEEEERQQTAEAREMARIRKEQESSGAPAPVQSGTWANASQRISWNASNVSKAPGKPAWGGAGIDAKPVVSAANWDGPSLQAANKIVQSAAPTTKKSAPQPAKPAPPKNTVKVVSVDPFTQWVTKRLKEINSEVDADVLSSFLESVENPNEVEDYIEGYLGSSKSAKEFVKEYLQKRSESRKRRDTDKDDLSSASQAGTGMGGTQGRKKKNKGARLIVDGSCLGFRATGDPNRVNQGEIETVFSSQKR